MPSSEPFLSSSEFEEVVFEENWYFLFTVMGMLQLSRYLTNRNKFNHTLCTCDLLTVIVHEDKQQPSPDDTIKAADLLVGVDSMVFAGEVLNAGCSTVSDLQRGCRVLQTHRWALLSLRC